MTDLYNRLLLQKEKIGSLEKELIYAKQEYLTLQLKSGIQYKKDLARKYLGLWDKSNKFPVDDELTNVIFFLAGSKEAKIPKTELKFDGSNFKFYYFNERLQAWLIIN